MEVSTKKRGKKKPKKLVLGDDAIESFEADWLNFKVPARELVKQLYTISKSSGVCCGIVGPWGSGKSSFMKLMEEHIRKESSWKKVHVAWFTAWDPGGIQELGDAMLYHFFRDVAGKEKKMAKVFKELQEALRIRRSLRDRARRVLEEVGEALPPTGQVITKVASGFIGELDSPMKVQRSFEKLMEWLEKEDRTVFLFVDDICRAMGEQIRDLLSELKVYVSNRRIVAVLAYDEDYVLNALQSPVLPPGIDPKKYLEKIVTIKRKVPSPKSIVLRSYAENLILSALGSVEKPTLTKLGWVSAVLSNSNPRRLKSNILTFVQLVSSLLPKSRDYGFLVTALLVGAATNMNFLRDHKVREAMNQGEESEIASAVEAFAKNNPSKSEDAKNFRSALDFIMPEFQPAVVSELRLFPSETPYTRTSSTQESEKEKFNWRVSSIPIITNAAMQGFKLPSRLVNASSKIVIPPSTKLEDWKIKYKNSADIVHYFEMEIFADKNAGCLLSWKNNDMLILLSSPLGAMSRRRYVSRRPESLFFKQRNILFFFEKCAHFVVEKGFALWLIDDFGIYNKDQIKKQIQRAQEISKGLKHPFVFLYTPPSKIKSLLEFLLNISQVN